MRAKVVLLAVLGLPAAVLPAWQDTPDPERDQLARQIRQRVAELQSVRDERQNAARAHEAERRRLQATLGELELEQQSLAAEEEVLAAEVEVLEGEASRSEDLAAAATFLEDFATAAAPVLERLRQRAEAGVPLQRGLRVARIAEVEARLREPDRLDEKTLAELWAWASEELRLAGGIEFFNEPVVLEDGRRQVHAYHLRLGLAQQFAISEDTGWIARADGERWVEIEEASEREALILALRVLQRQEAPEMVPVPLRIGGR